MNESARFETPPLPEQPVEADVEVRESELTEPNLTVFLMRHGESETDKSKPNRGLTELGREQVTENFNHIIDQLIADELPAFKEYDDPEKRKAALALVLANVELHLTDSGTDRTQEQAWLEREILLALGAEQSELTLPQSAYDWAVRNGKAETAPEGAGQGIKKRLAGVGGIDTAKEFRKKIGSAEYQQSLGASDEIIAWAKTPEDQIPAGVETRNQMETRLQRDLGTVEKVANKKLNDYPKRVVYVANSHASILTLAAASELKAPIEQVGEIDNAEGLRFDFYGNGKAHSTRPFGKHTEAKFERLKGLQAA